MGIGQDTMSHSIPQQVKFHTQLFIVAVGYPRLNGSERSQGGHGDHTNNICTGCWAIAVTLIVSMCTGSTAEESALFFLGKGPVQIKWKANACCNYDKINGSNFIRKQHIHVLTTKCVLIHMKLITERYQLIIVTLIHTFLAAAIFH